MRIGPANGLSPINGHRLRVFPSSVPAWVDTCCGPVISPLPPILFEPLQTAGFPLSTGITPFHRYWEPLLLPLVFHRLPVFPVIRFFRFAYWSSVCIMGSKCDIRHCYSSFVVNRMAYDEQ
jgi:hypothetical protein